MFPAEEFIYAFHPNRLTEFTLRAPNEAELIISTLEERRRWMHHWRPYRRRAAIIAEHYRLEREIFFSVALHDPQAAEYLANLKRPSIGLPEVAPIAGTAIALPALWITLTPNGHVVDRDALPALRKAMPLEPSCAISTGTGFDFYWLLREPWITESAVEQNAAAAMLRGWQEAIRRRTHWRGFEVAEQDLGAMLRFPESFDCDVPTPQPVLLEWMNDKRYERRDFEHLLPRHREPLALPPAGREPESAAEAARCDVVQGVHRLIEGLGGWATAAQMLERLADDDGTHDALRVALFELVPRLEPGELPSVRSLGRTLHNLRGKVYDDLTIVKGSKSRTGIRWGVERKSSS